MGIVHDNFPMVAEIGKKMVLNFLFNSVIIEL